MPRVARWRPCSAAWRNASQGNGAESLLGALERDHDGSLLDNLGALLQGSGGKATDGAGILKHVLGSKQRNVESALAKSNGIDMASAAKLLATVAPLVMSALARETQQKGMDAGQLSRYLGQERNDLARKAPQGMSLLDSILDTDGDGDVDITDMAKHGTGLLGKLFKQR
jgi:hypothetical protein